MPIAGFGRTAGIEVSSPRRRLVRDDMLGQLSLAIRAIRPVKFRDNSFVLV